MLKFLVWAEPPSAYSGSIPSVEVKEMHHRPAEQSTWAVVGDEGGFQGMEHFQAMPATGSEVLTENDSSRFLLSLPAFPQNSVAHTQIKTGAYGLEETVLPPKSRVFIARVYGSLLGV